MYIEIILQFITKRTFHEQACRNKRSRGLTKKLYIELLVAGRRKMCGIICNKGMFPRTVGKYAQILCLFGANLDVQ